MLDPRRETLVLQGTRDPGLRNCKLGSKTRDTCHACDLIPYLDPYQKPIKYTATRFQTDPLSDVKAQDFNSKSQEKIT